MSGDVASLGSRRVGGSQYRGRRAGLVLAVLLCGSALATAGCSPSAVDAKAQTGNVGVKLTATVNGTTYRLQGTFIVSGPTTTTLDTTLNPAAVTLTATLPVGNYAIALQDGWALQRLDPAGFVTVQASLVSPNPTAFSITAASTTDVVFQFSTDGTIVALTDGVLNVTIGVQNTSAVTGGLRLTWSLVGQVSGNTLTCASIPGAQTIDVLATSTTNPLVLIDNLFPCTAGTGDALGFPFDTYTISVALLDGLGQAIGTAPPVTVTLPPSPCVAIVSGSCLQSLSFTEQVPGL
jgi:hypothetical protein